MKEITAEIITIGDEILYGQIVDTNSQWMSGELSDAGIKTIRKTTVGDVPEDILQSFSEAEGRADIILITGGLGPTKDDLTKPLLAEYFNSPLIINEEALAEVKDFFERRGRELTALNKMQAELPEVCTKITNRMGTAPGMWFEKDGKVFVSMPGVPIEMKTIMLEEVIPKLHLVFNTPVIYHKMIKTIGIGESFLSEIIETWEDNLPENIKLAYLPSAGQVKLRLTAKGDVLSKLIEAVDQQIEKLKPLAGKYIYGYDKTYLPSAIGQLLRENGLTISTAESCTGGFLAHQITSVPGSSDYFQGSILSYADEVKRSELNVSKQSLTEHGAVSEIVAVQMAENVRKRLGTSIGLSTTGIAGPDGGSEEKPVGTVWIGYSDENGSFARKSQLTTDRLLNIQLTANIALNILRVEMLKIIALE
ncbi:MAG: competence/damage-inducible protein A [Bacteroidetes bacterium]|nr:competence/damage-inducible protein A [Bacteroidota bacterium]MDA1122522.1 competence/damage-inducible protein A [Bacteroidota bacterium]